MSAEGTCPSPIRRLRGRPRLRDAWSLAAGAALEPRVGVVLALVASAAVIAVDTRSALGGWQHFGHGAGPWIVAFAYPSWLLVTLAKRDAMRRIGRRRRRRHGGAVWWRDRASATTEVSRRIAGGMPGMRAPVALSILSTAAIAAGALFLGEGTSQYMTAEDLGWVSAPAIVVVAMYCLPFAWLGFVLVPRLGRGRLVVAWPTFPQFTGTRCSFHVGTSRGGATIENVRVFLRCVRVRRRLLVPLDAWNARLVGVAEASLPADAQVGPDNELRVRFDVSSRLPPTDLHAADAVRWELLVVGRVGITEYADSVVVPVYAPAA